MILSKLLHVILSAMCYLLNNNMNSGSRLKYITANQHICPLSMSYIYIFIYQFIMHLCEETGTYNVFPCCQNINPKIMDETRVNDIRTKLYEGLLQQDKYCFQRQALNCTQLFRGQRVGKLISFKSGAGVLKRLTSSLLSLY